MKKMIIVLFSVLFFSSFLIGAEITALDGTVYSHAEVISIESDGLLVNYTGKSGFNTVKLLKFTDLPSSVQIKYGYNSKKSLNFEKNHQNWLNKQQAIEVKRIAEQKSKQQQEKLDVNKRDIDKNPIKQQQAKLDGLVNSLDKMSNKSPEPSGGGGLSINNLIHDAVSSTEKQKNEINVLTK